jgi:hypothetical protein
LSLRGADCESVAVKIQPPKLLSEFGWRGLAATPLHWRNRHCLAPKGLKAMGVGIVRPRKVGQGGLVVGLAFQRPALLPARANAMRHSMTQVAARSLSPVPVGGSSGGARATGRSGSLRNPESGDRHAGCSSPSSGQRCWPADGSPSWPSLPRDHVAPWLLWWMSSTVERRACARLFCASLD